jgi:hypothetical protein
VSKKVFLCDQNFEKFGHQRHNQTEMFSVLSVCNKLLDGLSQQNVLVPSVGWDMIQIHFLYVRGTAGVFGWHVDLRPAPQCADSGVLSRHGRCTWGPGALTGES